MQGSSNTSNVIFGNRGNYNCSHNGKCDIVISKYKGERIADKNQDKNQSKNRAEQAEEHDESVLNPEIKNESDLSKKERRLIEKEKLKGMGPKKKLEYIWMYYKPAIFGVIAVIALIFGIKDYYEQSKIKTVLSMTVVNSMANDTETPEQKIKETLGYKDDPYSKVEIGVNLTTDSEMAEFDYNAQMAYVAQIQAGSIDIMVMPEKLYQTLKKNEPFADLKELMGEEAFEKFGMQTDTTHISITDSELEQELGVIYDPVCIAVPYSAPNQENAVKWIKSLDSRK